MKQLFTIFFNLLFCNILLSQCTELFISEYVEGWSNNKAIEIYNPTPNPIDLSYYSLARYTNGSSQASTPQQLEGTILPYSTVVIGIDKRDPDGESFDAPMWNGYYSFIEENPLCVETFEQEINIYFPENNLQDLVDFWSNGIYYSGTDPDSLAMYPQTMFFNGNDAIVLAAIGVGAVDIVGRIGEDPGAAWGDAEGNGWTKDHTLVRKTFIQSGVNANPTEFDPTLEWDSLKVNTFVNLGKHNCSCDPNYSGENIYGCTNPDAENYNPNANLDDNSCDYGDPCDYYEFWWSSNTSDLTYNNNTGFTAYPNPSKNSLINIVNNYPIKHMKIYDSKGRIIVNKSIDNQNFVIIDNIKNPGLYFLSIEDHIGVKTKSIVFQ